MRGANSDSYSMEGKSVPLANPTVKAKPWTVLPSLDQRGTGGLKGFPLAKIFAKTREDLVYDSERLMWLQVTGHLGTHTLGQISGLAETHDNMFNIVSHQGNVH